MFSAIRKRVTYANVAMTLALVFAMTGGAYAAKRYLITSTKQISPKVLKHLKGARGRAGATGAQGPAGPQGPAGANGKDGTNGVNGKDGESVTVTAIKAGEAACNKLGGAKLSNATGTATTCNGQTGFTATLPEEATETGSWAAHPAEGEEPVILISFNIPLEGALEASHVHIAPEPTNCPGTAEEPKAAPGNFCLYVGAALNATVGNIFNAGGSAALEPGLSRTGGFLTVKASGVPAIIHGTWAVTAE